MLIFTHYIVLLLPSFSLKRIIVSALRLLRVQKDLFSSWFPYQLSITRYCFNNAKHFSEAEELWEHVSSEDSNYFCFNCSEQLLNDMLFFNYGYCEYLV